MCKHAKFCSVPLVLLTVLSTGGTAACRPGNAARLAPRNTEVPFAYLDSAERRWPILVGRLAEEDRLKLEHRQDGQVVASGQRVKLDGVSARIDRQGHLAVSARPGIRARPTLHLVLSQGDTITRRTLFNDDPTTALASRAEAGGSSTPRPFALRA